MKFLNLITKKCINIFDSGRFFTFDDAEKSCSQLGDGSSILSIYSKEEQDFISDSLFKTNKMVDNVWLGLKKNSNVFK
jgi:hypothetical protein